MKTVKLEDLNLLDVGASIQIIGTVWSNGTDGYICYLPDETPCDALDTLQMSSDEWVKFIRQTDVLETEILQRAKDGTVTKAIVRKSQRLIDNALSWRVFKRDEYSCRYCGAEGVPLSVDHLILWEEGGPSTPDNLVTACKPCNRKRGSTPYAEWLGSDYYRKKSRTLPLALREKNAALIKTLDTIPRLVHTRTR